MGLKENVIIGKLIPAGTGLSAYPHFAEELVPVTEEELQEEQSKEQATGVEALQDLQLSLLLDPSVSQLGSLLRLRCV